MANRPPLSALRGRRVLLTRTEEQAVSSFALLAHWGAVPLIWSAISVKAIDNRPGVLRAIASAGTYDWVLLTSANAARFFLDVLAREGSDLSAFQAARLGVVGPRTASALARLGKQVDLVAESFVAESLADSVLARIPTGARVLLPRAAVAREVIPETLRAAGCVVDVLPVYETGPGDSPEALAALLAGGVDAVLFSSSSTVTYFAEALERVSGSVRGAVLAAIGPVTAETMRLRGLHPSVVAEVHTMEALVEALARHFEVPQPPAVERR
jgi:uroporphyrinogen III methyltransferase/synthase